MIVIPERMTLLMKRLLSNGDVCHDTKGNPLVIGSQRLKIREPVSIYSFRSPWSAGFYVGDGENCSCSVMDEVEKKDNNDGFTDDFHLEAITKK